jgi:hypothetical protein
VLVLLLEQKAIVLKAVLHKVLIIIKAQNYLKTTPQYIV